MKGLLWVLVTWLVVLAAFERGALVRLFIQGTLTIPRTRLALALSLLGSFSGAAAGSPTEVLANPVVIERIVRGVLAVLAFLIILPTGVGFVQRRRPFHSPTLFALTSYVGVAAITTLYSVAPLVTVGKVVELVLALAIVWTIFLSEDAPVESWNSIRLLIHLMASLIVVAVIGFFVVPSEFSDVGQRTGFLFRQTMISPFMHSNGLSAVSAMIAAYALGQALIVTVARLRWWCLMSIGAAGVLLSAGRQGLVMMALAMAVVLFFKRRTWFVLLIFPSVLGMAWLYGDQLFRIVLRGQPIGLFLQLSGRWTWWTSALAVWREHPFTGFGFGVGGRFVALDRIGFGDVSSVHNGYLEALIGVGAVGAAFLVYLTGRIVAYSLRVIRFAPAEGILIVPLMLHTLVSLGYGGWLGPQWMIFAILAGRADLTSRFRNPQRLIAGSEPALDRALT